MRASNERLTILSKAEQAALYELPNFDDEQRLHYLNLTPKEQTLMLGRSNNAKLIDLDMIVNNLVLQSKKDKITTKNKQDVYALTA